MNKEKNRCSDKDQRAAGKCQRKHKKQLILAPRKS